MAMLKRESGWGERMAEAPEGRAANSAGLVPVFGLLVWLLGALWLLSRI
jgi:hypothetical protein